MDVVSLIIFRVSPGGRGVQPAFAQAPPMLFAPDRSASIGSFARFAIDLDHVTVA
jgi:hypothetical protein